MARDPYHYFRIEAVELVEGLGGGLTELEKGGGPDVVRKLLRLAHTLKGAARVVKLPEIGDLAHKIEDLLSPGRDSGTLDAVAANAAAKHVESIRQRLVSLGSPAAAASQDPAPPKAVSEDGLAAVRIEIGELDGLIGGISECIATAAALRGDCDALSEAAGETESKLERASRHDLETGVRLRKSLRAIESRAEQVIASLSALRGSAIEVRLVPAQVLVAEMERAAHDAAHSLSKSVTFTASGADTRIDAAALATLRGALRHVVRNAVAHGIEDDAARRAAGKSTAGRIHVAIERRGHRVSVICRDDGAGFNLDNVRRAAIDRGLVTATQATGMDARRLVDLLLRGGVSTARKLSQVAGRGIGLDVVRETAAKLKGEVDIRTTPGKGTEVEIIAPLSLSALPALELMVEGASAYVPLDSISGTLRLRREAFARGQDGERIRFADSFIPYAPLSRVLGRRSAPSGDAQTVVVLAAGESRAAVGVERLGGVREIIVRNVPDHVRAGALVAGAALDESGVPRLVLAPAAVVHAVGEVRGFDAPPQQQTRPPVLVIDDSLTTRMLEQSILESAGYEVDVAVCAEDALEMARRRRYGVFIVDVEMPGMNGFDFVAITRADPELRDTPAVLVTSRSDSEDKRRGKEAGARAYVVKSEFDQQQMLALIERLMG